MPTTVTDQNIARYEQKKAFFQQLLTIYGRKPVLEALSNPNIPCYRLHLAESNKDSNIIRELKKLAEQRTIETHYHDKLSLSRISKNGKQDQGVCLDIHCPSHQSYDNFIKNRVLNNKIVNSDQKIRLLALDNITNPQNLGMIIRSSCAGNIDGILLPSKGCAKLDSLVIKASAGTLFKAPLLHCQNLANIFDKNHPYRPQIIALSSQASQALHQVEEDDFVIYVLGNESKGISEKVLKHCQQQCFIPMNNGVESLNVAITASLIAFRGCL